MRGPPVTSWSAGGLCGVLLAAATNGCGSNGTDGRAGEVGTYDPDGGPSFGSGDARSSGALDARIEENGIAVQIVTLSCSGDCADVVAVATGGRAPYAFAWTDGATGPMRHVCPTSSTNYRVQVTDTATTGELAMSAQTASASVTADVLQCADAGGPRAALCLVNGSFEGTPEALEGFETDPPFEAPPWNACASSNPDYTPSSPDIVNDQTLSSYGSAPLPPATDGATYAHLGYQWPLHEYVTQKLCQPMVAGTAYSFTVDLASREGTLPPQLEVYGSSNDCSRRELLWTSPVLTTSWARFCVTLRPTAEAGYLTLNPTGASLSTSDVAFVLADDMTPVDHCP